MQNTPDIALIVGICAVLIGTGWGMVVDPLRPATYWIAAVSVALTGFLTAGLAPDAVMSTPLLVMAFTVTSWVRKRMWRASLIRNERPPSTPLPPSASATS